MMFAAPVLAGGIFHLFERDGGGLPFPLPKSHATDAQTAFAGESEHQRLIMVGGLGPDLTDVLSSAVGAD